MLEEPQLELEEDCEPTSRHNSPAAPALSALALAPIAFPHADAHAESRSMSLQHALRGFSTQSAGGASMAADDQSLIFTGVADTIATLGALTADVAHQQHRAAEAIPHVPRHSDGEGPRGSSAAHLAHPHAGSSATSSAGGVLATSQAPSPRAPLVSEATTHSDCPLLAMLSQAPPTVDIDVFDSETTSGYPSPLDAVHKAGAVVTGRGASGHVVLAFSPRLGTCVAVKQVAACAAADRRAEIVSEMAFADRAAAVLRGQPEAPWRHICRVHGASVEGAVGATGGGTCTVVTEALLGGTLRDHATTITTRRPDLLRVVARHVLLALDTLHTQLRVVHNDLKLDNVMLAAPLDASSDDDEPTFKVIDFGCASLLPLTLRPSDDDDVHKLPQRGSLQAMSPERLLGRRYGPKADVWSLGVLLLSLARGGKHPFLCPPAPVNATESSPCAPSSTDTFWRLAATMRFVDGDAECAEACAAVVGRSITDGALAYTPAFRDFILQAMHTNPAQRADVATLLNHPWIK